MITLITGGSGSGKSAYAEECIGMLSEGCHKYYLATMQVFGEEGQAKVERHQKLRSGKRSRNYKRINQKKRQKASR